MGGGLSPCVHPYVIYVLVSCRISQDRFDQGVRKMYRIILTYNSIRLTCNHKTFILEAMISSKKPDQKFGNPLWKEKRKEKILKEYRCKRRVSANAVSIEKRREKIIKEYRCKRRVSANAVSIPLSLNIFSPNKTSMLWNFYRSKAMIIA